MQPKFRSLPQIKAHLPEVLERIKLCRKCARIEQAFVDVCIKEQIRELTDDTGCSWFGSDAALKESYRNSVLYGLEADWLESQVKRLKEHPNI